MHVEIEHREFCFERSCHSRRQPVRLQLLQLGFNGFSVRLPIGPPGFLPPRLQSRREVPQRRGEPLDFLRQSQACSPLSEIGLSIGSQACRDQLFCYDHLRIPAHEICQKRNTLRLRLPGHDCFHRGVPSIQRSLISRGPLHLLMSELLETGLRAWQPATRTGQMVRRVREQRRIHVDVDGSRDRQ